jgi:PAS domain S-box-containing protein
MTHVKPTGVERHFGADEMIVTKTDLKGRLTYANDVFCRVSAYPEAEMLGQPHSMIRHPDMPRAIFKLLWESLEHKRELFAYVMNLAGDGAHYWVFAHVTPSIAANGSVVGYHSNRRLPDPRVIAQIRPLYQQLVTEEHKHSRASEAAQAGVDRLHEILADHGTTYDEHVWTLTNGVMA